MKGGVNVLHFFTSGNDEAIGTGSPLHAGRLQQTGFEIAKRVGELQLKFGKRVCRIDEVRLDVQVPIRVRPQDHVIEIGRVVDPQPYAMLRPSANTDLDATLLLS